MKTKDQDRPYFMDNPEWYYFDANEWCYKLTDKAPEAARESYAEFYETTYVTESGQTIVVD